MEDRCFEGVTHDIHDTDDVHTCTHVHVMYVCMYVKLHVRHVMYIKREKNVSHEV